MDVTDRNIQFLGNESPETSRIEYTGHSDDAVFGELRHHQRHLRHGIERIGNGDDDCVRRLRNHFLGHFLDDRVILEHEVVAAHAGLTGQACCDDHHVGTGGRAVIVRAGQGYVVTFDRSGLKQVEGLALWNALHEVHEDDVAEFLFGSPYGTVRTDIAGADHGNLISQSKKSFLKRRKPQYIVP